MINHAMTQHDFHRHSQSLSVSLLDHDGLMTPKLVDAFGPLKAVKITATDTATTHQRHSKLRRRSDDTLILTASLEVNKSEVPSALVDALSTSDRLFGQLLNDFGVSVQVTKRALFRTPSGQFGRNVTMTRLGFDRPLCCVQETLSIDTDLQALLREDWNR